MIPAEAPHVSEDMLHQLAAFAGLTIAPGHAPGVIRQLETLMAQAGLLFAAPLSPLAEPAPAFRP